MRAGSRWVALVTLSLLLAAGFELAGMSAGLLLGPMGAAILFALRGRAVAIPARAFQAAQALIGILIAGSLGSGIARTVFADWPIFLGCTLATLGASATLGYLLSRRQILPHTTAIWGSMPGAASAMTIMADSFGADSRLVAFMTYSRVVCIAGVASFLATLLTGQAHGDLLAELIAPVPLNVTLVSLGVALAGGTNTTVNPLYTPQELSRQLNDCCARFLVSHTDYLENALDTFWCARKTKLDSRKE